MKYSDCLAYIEARPSLLSDLRVENRDLDTILIVPANDHSLKLFQELYLSSYDMEIAISPFMEEDCEIIAISLKHLKNNGLFAYKYVVD